MYFLISLLIQPAIYWYEGFLPRLWFISDNKPRFPPWPLLEALIFSSEIGRSSSPGGDRDLKMNPEQLIEPQKVL